MHPALSDFSALSRRTPTPPCDALLASLACVPLHHVSAVPALLPPLVDALRALPPSHRAPLLREAYGALSLVDVTHTKRALEALMLDTPHGDVTAAFVSRVAELRAQFEFARRWPDPVFSEGFTREELSTMKPRAHPVMQSLVANLDAYVRIARDAGLPDDADTLRRHLDAMLDRRRAPRA